MTDINPGAPEPRKRNPLWLILGIVGGVLALLCVCGAVSIGALTMMGSRVSSVFDKINTSLAATQAAISTGGDTTPTPLAVIGNQASDTTPTPLAVIRDQASDITPEATSDTQTSAPGDGTTFTANNGQSQITGPTSWRELTTLNKNADLQVGNKVQEQYLIVFTEDKASANVSDLAEYAGLVRDSFTKNFPDATVSKPRNLTINGLPATQYRVRATVQNVAITYWFTAVEGKHNFFQIVSWTLQEDEAKNRDTIEQAVESFRELTK